MPTLPSTIALTSIAASSEILSVDHRNNYTAIQTAVNALTAALSGGTAGQALLATSSTAVAYGPTYTAYTPTWTASGTAPAIGNSTVFARYSRIGTRIHAYGSIQFGNTATYGTGTYALALPVASANLSANVIHGTCMAVDASTGNLLQAVVAPLAASTMQFSYGATYLGVTTFIGQLAPWTWTTSDLIYWNITYESA